MKTLLAAAAIAAAMTMPAHAEDYSRIPFDIRARIHTKCIARYPDDYSMQDGCIMSQSSSYLRVHGSGVPDGTVTSTCHYDKLPIMRHLTGGSLGWQLQIGNAELVDLNVAAQFQSAEADGKDYYFDDRGVTVTDRKTGHSELHRGKCR